MVQLCPHVNCTASYELDDGDEGKTFRCEQCGSLLLFEGGSLAVISNADTDKADTPRSLSLGNEKSGMLTSAGEGRSIPALAFSWFLAFLFAVGSFLIVLFFFLPLIDQAGLSRQLARIDAGDRQQVRLDDKLWNRNIRRNPRDPFGDRMFDKGRDFDFKGVGDPAPPPPNEEAQKKRKTERAEWEKTRDKLDDELEDSRTSARSRLYFYAWGMLFGFLILGMASVGFLSFGPTTTRRVFGGIVISAEILLIFTAYFVAHNALRFNPFP